MHPHRMPYIPIEGSQGEPTKDYISKQLYKTGQVGPHFENRWLMAHGRYLAGLGSNETQQPWAPEEEDNGGFLRDLEKEDDVYGSGLFDAYGRPGTVNPDMGVFADHPSLPGYVDREELYTVSKDVSDITNGADVIVVAPGGMTYQEQNGRTVDFGGRGTGPCPPVMRPDPRTYLEQGGYASLTPRGPQAPTPRLPPGVGPRFIPLPGPARPPSGRWPTPPPIRNFNRSVPMDRVATAIPLIPAVTPLAPNTVSTITPTTPGIPYRAVPANRTSRRVGVQSIVNTGVEPGGQTPPRQVAFNMRPARVRTRDVSLIGERSVSVSAPTTRRGFSDAEIEDDAPGVGTYLFAGLLVGVGAAMVYGATKMGKRR